MKKTSLLLIITLFTFIFSCENEKLDLTAQEQTETTVNLDLKKEYSIKNIESALATGGINIPINDNFSITAQNLKKVENISFEGNNPFFKNRRSYVGDNIVIAYNEEELFLNYTNNDQDYILSYSTQTQRDDNNEGIRANKNFVDVIEKEHFTLATTNYTNTNKIKCKPVSAKDDIITKNELSLKKAKDKNWKLRLYYDRSNMYERKKFKVSLKTSINFFEKTYAFVKGVNIEVTFRQKKGIYSNKEGEHENTYDRIFDRLLKYLKKKKKTQDRRIYMFIGEEGLTNEELDEYFDGIVQSYGRHEGYRYGFVSVESKKTLAHEVAHLLGAKHNNKKYRKNNRNYYSFMNSEVRKYTFKGFKNKNRKIISNTLRNKK